MKVTYTLQPDDGIALYESGRQRGTIFQRSPLATIAAIMILLFCVGLDATLRPSAGRATTTIDWIMVPVLPLLLGVFLLGVLKWHRARYEKQFTKSISESEPRTIEIAEAGVLYRSGEENSVMSWSELVQIADVEKHFLFWLRNGSALVIPKRAFHSQEQQKQFHDLACMLWQTNCSTVQ